MNDLMQKYWNPFWWKLIESTISMPPKLSEPTQRFKFKMRWRWPSKERKLPPLRSCPIMDRILDCSHGSLVSVPRLIGLRQLQLKWNQTKTGSQWFRSELWRIRTRTQCIKCSVDCWILKWTKSERPLKKEFHLGRRQKMPISTMITWESCIPRTTRYGVTPPPYTDAPCPTPMSPVRFHRNLIQLFKFKWV